MPLAQAKTTILRGEQGSGKTNTLVGFIVDAYFPQVYALQAPDGRKYAVRPCHDEGGRICRDRVVINRNGASRVLRIPKGWIPLSHQKVFTNFHLYGLRYVYCTVHDLLKWLNEDIIVDGILGVDEGYILGESRTPTRGDVVLFTQFIQQVRKRRVDLYLLTQHGRLIDWRMRWQSNRDMTCRYDERTRRVHLIIKNVKKNREKTTSYWAPQYWPYYNTEELPDIPQKRIERVLQRI